MISFSKTSHTLSECWGGGTQTYIHVLEEIASYHSENHTVQMSTGGGGGGATVAHRLYTRNPSSCLGNTYLYSYSEYFSGLRRLCDCDSYLTKWPCFVFWSSLNLSFVTTCFILPNRWRFRAVVYSIQRLHWNVTILLNMHSRSCCYTYIVLEHSQEQKATLCQRDS